MVEYIASDETLDSYREIIRAAGWKFDERFVSNPVFVDSHSYWQIKDVLGRVVEWRVEGGKLHEVVQWAIDVEENHTARLGFQMTAKGYLKAVSVGFMPVVTYRRESDEWTKALDEMKVSGEARDKARTIFWEQQQHELSACVLGANPSALAKAFGDGAVSGDLLAGVGLGGDEGQEMLALVGEAWDASADPAIRSLVRMQLRQFVTRQLSVGRGPRRTAGPHPGAGATGGQLRQSPREQRAWLKTVAEGIGLQN